MKKICAFILALMVAVSCGAYAEQATLVYSFGEDALNKVLMDQKNTVSYNGNTYVFDFGGFSFEGAFSMLGGNTRTVYECEVPKARMEMLSGKDDIYLGTVYIAPVRNMELYVFSGDRRDGSYALIDSQRANSYTLDIYATRDEYGTLRLIDYVFLYSYQNGGTERYYAASVYIAYEGYRAASADIRPGVRVFEEEEDLQALVATYAETIAMLETEKAEMFKALDELAQELADVQAAKDGADQVAENVKVENEQLNAALAQAEARYAALESEMEKLEKEYDKVLEVAGPAKLEEMTRQIMGLEKANVELASQNEALNARASKADELNAQNAALESGIKDAQAEKENAEAQLEACRAELDAVKNALETETQKNDALNKDVLNLQAENEKLYAENSEIAALLQTIEKLESEYEALNTQAEERISQLEKENESLSENLSDIDALNAEIKRLTEENAELYARLENAHFSDAAENTLELDSLSDTELACLMYANTMAACEKLADYMDELVSVRKMEAQGASLSDADEAWLIEFVNANEKRSTCAGKMTGELQAVSENATIYTPFEYVKRFYGADASLSECVMEYLHLIGAIENLDEIERHIEDAIKCNEKLMEVNAGFRYRATVEAYLDTLISVHSYLESNTDDLDTFCEKAVSLVKENRAFASDFAFVMRNLFKEQPGFEDVHAFRITDGLMTYVKKIG